MRLTRIILLLAIASPCSAGQQNPGPGANQVVDLWTSQALTTAGATTTSYYPVGLDGAIFVDVTIAGAEAGDTVTLTPTWQLPGGNLVGYPTEHHEVPQATTWTAGQLTHFALKITPPPGVEGMYLSGLTSDTDGCTITASCIGTR